MTTTAVLFYLRLSAFICGFNALVVPVTAAASSGGAPELVLNIDHVGEITAIAVSPDSTTIASGSRDQTVKLWDAATGKLLRTLSGHREAVLSVTFAADGATVYSGSRDGTVRAWATQNGRLLGTFAGSGPAPAGGAVTAIAAMPVRGAGGETALVMARAVGAESQIHLWRAGGAPAEPVPPLTGHKKTVRVLAFSPDGKLLASGSDDGAVKLWDAEDGALQRTLKGNAMPLRALAFSPDSTLLLSGCDDGIAIVWDVASGKERQELNMNRPGDGVGAVAISPDNAVVVTGGHGGPRRTEFLKLWDAPSGKELRVMAGHDAFVTAAAFSPDGRYFVTGARDSTLRVWDRQGAAEASRAVGRGERVAAVACDPASGMAATAGADGAVRVWNGRTGALVHTLAGHTGPALAVAFSPDGQTLASGGRDGSVRLWSARTGEAGRKLSGATGPVNTLAFSPDGQTVIGGTGASVADGAVALWDVSTGALRQTFSGESLGMVHAVAVSPDGTLIATGSNAWNGGAFRVWDAATGKLLLREGFRTVRAVAFSPDGKQLAAGYATLTEEGEPVGEEIGLWNARTRELQRTLTAPEEGGGTLALAYSDNATLISGSRTGTLRVWNTRTAQLAQTLTGHLGAVHSLAPASPRPGAGAADPAPALLASGGMDNTLRVWRIGAGATRLLATLVALPPAAREGPADGGWIALAPEGFYDSTPGAERLIAWRVGGSLFPVEAFEPVFHRPDMVRRALQGEVLPETGEVAAFTRGASVPPQLQFNTPRDGQDIAGAKKLQVDLTVTDERKVTRVEVLANGRPVAAKPLEVAAKPIEVAAKPLEVAAKPLEVAAKPLEIAAKPLEVAAKPLEVAAKPLEVAAKPIPTAHRMLQQFRVEVPLPAGDAPVTLAALAFNEKSLQAREEVRLTRGGGPASAPASPAGTLYVLSVGVSQYRDPKYNLKYASRDAETFAGLWSQQNGSALYRSVSVTRLTDAEATAPRVRAALFRILESATENDTVALFLSGHGVQAGEADYYFATHEIDPATRARVAETALPWKVLQTTLAAVKARRVLLFLDACHSGNALGAQQAENERMAELLVKRAGVMVFASSRGSEFSYELDEARQGAFTAALVEAITGGKADLEVGGRRDGTVTAEELLVYLRARVPQLTENRQTPSCPLLRDFGEAYPVARLR